MLRLESKIDAVKVYRRGATILRTATLVVDGNAPAEIELPYLPLSLLDPTVRVTLHDVEPKEAQVVAADVRVGLFVKPRAEVLAPPDKRELLSLEKDLAKKREMLAHVDAEAALLTAMQVPDRPEGEPGKPPPPAPLATRLALEQFTDEATRARLVDRRALQVEIDKLDEERARVLDRIARASTAEAVQDDEITKSVVVRLAMDGAPLVRATIHVEYTVPGARWAPAYQFRLSADGRAAELRMRAWIAQRTGEDWRGVRLKLSTATPLTFTELPELSALKIGRAQSSAPKPLGFRPPPQGADALFRDFDRDRAAARALVPAPAPWRAPALVAPQTYGSTRGAASAARPEPAKKKREMAAPRDAERFDESDEPTGAGAAEEVDAFDEDRSQLLSADDDLMEYEPAGAPPPPPAAPMRMAAKASMARGRAPEPVLGGGGAPIDEVVQSLVFPLLRLPAADEGARGTLRPVDVRTSYRESVARFGRPMSADPASVALAAEQDAQAVGRLALPEGTVDVNELTTHFDFAYDADDPVDVPADGGFHSIPIGTRAAEARTTYVVVPREDTNVFRTANLVNPLASPLLPGPAEVYVGGEYVLTTRLAAVPSRGELKLGLGVEQSIKCARNARYSELRSGTKVVAMSELVHEVDVKIVNHLAREVEIEVRERVPVPATGAEVVVEEGPVQPAWEPYDQVERNEPIEGGRRWKITVDAGATSALTARYVVKLYANNELVGGNRREA